MIQIIRSWRIRYQSLLLLFILFALYGVFSQFFDGILPIHEWRKSDSLAVALNYANGASFLEPQTQWISANGCRNAAAEFPIIYFIIGKIWALTGPQEWIPKALSLSLLFISLSLFSEVMFQLLGNTKKTLLFIFFIVSSPVLIFYSDTLLPNIYAFSFLLLGGFGVFHFFQTKSIFWLGFLTIVFSLSVLLKVTVLIALFSFSGAWVAYCLFHQNSFFKKYAFYFITLSFAFCFLLLVNFLWYRYAIQYNHKMGSDLFSTTIRPIWEVDKETRNRIWSEFWRHMLPSLYHPSVLIICGTCIFYGAMKKWISPFMIWLMCISAIGISFYFILWFWVFDVHDYYLIEVLYFMGIIFFVVLKIVDRLKLKSKAVKLISFLGVFVLFFHALSYAQWSFGRDNFFTKNTPFMSKYVKGNWGYFHFYHRDHLGQLQAQKESIQQCIPESDTVICLSDPSPNIHLFTIKRIGFSQYSFHEPFDDETNQIQQMIQKGANFALIVEDQESLPRKDWELFFGHLVYAIGKVKIYDLRPYRVNSK